MITDRMDVLEWLRNQLEDADADLLREMVRTFAETLMGAEADVLCGASYGQRSVERVNRRNGYRGVPVGHAGGQHRPAHPEAAGGLVFP